MNPLPKTFAEALAFFATPDACLTYLVARRWPNGIACPRCGSRRVYFDSSRRSWECRTRHPRRKFSLKTGTVFEDSAIGFEKWLPAVWMIANGTDGGLSVTIRRTVGVTYKTAWFMVLRVRLAMRYKRSCSDNVGKTGTDGTLT
jgi:hypothetical protein